MTTFFLNSIVLIAAALSTIDAARADFQIERWETHAETHRGFSIRTDASFLSTNVNYAPDGSTYEPSGLASANRIHWDTTLQYGLTPELTAYGRLSWTKASLDHPTIGQNRFGLGDQALGLSYRVWSAETLSDGNRSTNLRLQAQVELPAYDNSAAIADGTPWLGNQSTDLSVGAFVELPAGDSSEQLLSVIGGVGFTKRGKTFANQLPYSFEFRIDRPTGVTGLIGRAGIFGVIPLQSDPFKGLPLTSLSSVGSGGSFLTGSTAPSLSRAHIELGYQTSPKLALFGQFDTSLFGKSAQKDTRFGAGLVYRFGDGSDSQIAEETDDTLVKPRAKRSNRGFIGYDDQFEAKVVKVNDRLNLLKINRGSNDGIAPGQTFHLFSLDASGSAAKPVARAEVQSVRPEESALLITEYYQEVAIEEGFVAKRPFQNKPK